MKPISTLLALILVLQLASCSTMKQKRSGDSKIAFYSIAKGEYSGIEEKRQIVITGIEALRNIWTEVFSIYHPAPGLPEIDFEKNTIIGVFMGTLSTGGYSIEIVEITETAKHILVKYRVSSPSPGSMVTMALSQPYHIVSMLKTTKEVIFQALEN